MVTGEPPSAVGVIDLPSLYSGKSSLSITGEPLIASAGVHQLAVRSGQPDLFDGIERLDVEVDGGGGVVDDEMWQHSWG